MARFTKTVNIWNLTDDQRAALQPGQHVTAGEGADASHGRFYGQGASTVVAWSGNARGRYLSYHAFMADYGKVVRSAAALRALAA